MALVRHHSRKETRYTSTQKSYFLYNVSCRSLVAVVAEARVVVRVVARAVRVARAAKVEKARAVALARAAAAALTAKARAKVVSDTTCVMRPRANVYYDLKVCEKC